MKTLALVLAMTVVGCVQPPVVAPVQVEDASVATNLHKTVVHDFWEMSSPNTAWELDETVLAVDGMTQVLVMKSHETFGREPIRATLMTTPVADDGPSFAINVAHCSLNLGTARSVDVIRVDDHPATVTRMGLNTGAGITLVGTTNRGLGYVMMCGGDREQAPTQVDEACTWITNSFHLK